MASCFATRARKNYLALASALVATFAFANAGQAQVDGWGTDGGPGSPSYISQSSFGVTMGSNALQSTLAAPGFWGPSTGNLLSAGGGNHLTDFQNATTLQLDLTMLAASFPAGFGFAQSNEMSISIFSSPGGSLPSGVNAFIQRNAATGGATDSLNPGGPGQYNGDGTRHMTWNLNNFTLTDPTDSVVKSVPAFLLAHPDTQDAKFNFVQQTGGSGPGSFYFDAVRLTNGTGQNAVIGNFEAVPEPSTLVLLGSCAFGCIANRWRKSRKATTTAV